MASFETRFGQGTEQSNVILASLMTMGLRWSVLHPAPAAGAGEGRETQGYGQSRGEGVKEKDCQSSGLGCETERGVSLAVVHIVVGGNEMLNE